MPRGSAKILKLLKCAQNPKTNFLDRITGLSGLIVVFLPLCPLCPLTRSLPLFSPFGPTFGCSFSKAPPFRLWSIPLDSCHICPRSRRVSRMPSIWPVRWGLLRPNWAERVSALAVGSELFKDILKAGKLTIGYTALHSIKKTASTPQRLLQSQPHRD